MAHVDLALDYRVLGATAVVTAAAGLLIGVAPVLRLDPARAQAWLKAGGRGSVGAGRGRLQQSLIAFQISLAVL